MKNLYLLLIALLIVSCSENPVNTPVNPPVVPKDSLMFGFDSLSTIPNPDVDTSYSFTDSGKFKVSFTLLTNYPTLDSTNNIYASLNISGNGSSSIWFFKRRGNAANGDFTFNISLDTLSYYLFNAHVCTYTSYNIRIKNLKFYKTN